MSYTTWKQLYYPVSVRDFRNQLPEPTMLQYIDHSILKWCGLEKKILVKHELVLYKGDNYLPALYSFSDLKVFTIDDLTCSLCALTSSPDSRHRCSRCPITKLTSRSCLDNTDKEGEHSPWQAFVFIGDPHPMQSLLARVRKLHIEQE